ncbi:MAG TPA: imidazoleglycerol-phosphate dehydratase [Ruminococcaceae bacterium]|nr:imidazoleglycerol-phosphate dehydratase [Oscillospiraceae bacterium]
MRSSNIEKRNEQGQISVSLSLDGNGRAEVNTGSDFLDHLLVGFTECGRFNLELRARIPNDSDLHHTIEIVGDSLGEAFGEALKGATGIRRYGNFFMPVGDALVMAAVDATSIPYLKMNLGKLEKNVGGFDLALVETFLHAFACSAKMNVHVMSQYGSDFHNIVEAAFKALGNAIGTAVYAPYGNTTSLRKGNAVTLE